MINLHSYADFQYMLPFDLVETVEQEDLEKLYESFYCPETQEYCLDYHDVCKLLQYVCVEREDR